MCEFACSASSSSKRFGLVSFFLLYLLRQDAKMGFYKTAHLIRFTTIHFVCIFCCNHLHFALEVLSRYIPRMCLSVSSISRMNFIFLSILLCHCHCSLVSRFALTECGVTFKMAGYIDRKFQFHHYDCTTYMSVC